MKQFPQSLQKAANLNGLTIHRIAYTSHGCTNYGFDLCKEYENGNKYIQVSIEPVYYSNGERWKIKNNTLGFPRLTYLKNLRSFKEQINVQQTSYILN